MNLNRLKERGFVLYGRLPKWARVFIIRRATPSYNVGAMCVLRRADGAVLLLRNSYREGWGLPGGLLRRREHALDAVMREVREEVGLDVEIDADPRLVIDPRARRIDIVFTGHLRAEDEGGRVSSTSPEVREVGWFELGGFPALQKETAEILELVGLVPSGS